MTSNFALSLSFDGLRLMHRVEGGWHAVGEVALDVDDLGSAMAALKSAAETLEPDGIATKLLIPNDQIKYLAIDTTRATEDDVREALHDATPYALDDLVYDFAKGGGRTYVAAVARATLDEARAFAAEHDFNPVSFAAIPEPFTYMGEAFFGAVNGHAITRDPEPVVVIGDADVTVPEPPSHTATEPPSQPEPETASAPEPQLETEAEVKSEDRPGTPHGSNAHPVDNNIEGEPASSVEDLAEADAAPDPTAAAIEEPSTDSSIFSSLRADRSAGQPVGGSTEPSETSRETQPAKRVEPPVLAGPGRNDDPGTQTKRRLRASQDENDQPAPTPLSANTPEPVAAPPVTGKAANVLSPDEAGATLAVDAAPTPERSPKTVDGITPDAARAIGSVGGMFASRRKLRSDRSADTPPPTEDTRADKGRLTVFGARKAPQKAVVGGKPRFLGLILTVVVLVFLLAVAALAAWSDERIARWFGFDSERTLAETDDEPGASEGLSSPVTVTDVAVDDVPPASADVATPAPSEDDVASAEIADDPVAGAGADQVASDPADPDMSAPQPPTPALGQVLSPEDAARIYAATGVWQRAPRLPVTPGTTTLDAFEARVSITQVTRVPSSPLADANAVAGDAVIAMPVNPPPPTTEFDFDDDGRVIATPEGALNPDQVLIIAGRPPFEPPIRPGTVAPIVTPQDRLARLTAEGARPLDDVPDGVIVIAGRPAISPPIRPGTSAPPPLPQTVALNNDASALVEEEGLIVIAGAPSLRPPIRPQAPQPQSPTPDPAQAATPPATIDPIAPTVTDPFAPSDAAIKPQPSTEEVIVIAGPPTLRPPVRPQIAAQTPPAASEDEVVSDDVDTLRQDVLAALARPTPEAAPVIQAPDAATARPLSRPASVAEQVAVAAQEATVSDAIASISPAIRPVGLAPAPVPEPAPETPEITVAQTPSGLQLAPEIAAAVEAAQNRPDPFATATERAVSVSRRPDNRPRNMARIVARAQEAEAAQQRAAANQVASAAVAPSGPTGSLVARNATLENAINLRQINLIGIYGSDGNRRALVRLSNGRFVRVTVGDRLDGGRVTAISSRGLSYDKRGRSITLEVAG